jgi:hypothetical protein
MYSGSKLVFTPLPSGVCNNLLSATTGPQQDSGLLYVYDASLLWLSAAGGVLTPTDFNACTGQIAWTFNL